MKKLNVSIIVLMVLSSMLSCVDSDYHWDNLNKEGIINVPPVPLGSFEAIKFKDLDGTQIILPGLPQVTYKFKYSLNNLFGTSSVKRFFHDYVYRDISIQGLLEMHVLGENSGAQVDIDFEPLTENNEIIEGVGIEGLKDVKYGVRDLQIVIPQKNVYKMKEAKHLQMTISLTTPSSVVLTAGDSIKLSKMIIKTAGYLVDL